MSKKPAQSLDASALRRRAEEKIIEDNCEHADAPALSEADTTILVHELRTHQIELELQNIELRQAQEDLIESHNRYADLYEFAPIGYATVSPKGMIAEANFAILELLGIERKCLIGQPLSSFIAPEDQDTYYRVARKTIGSDQIQNCQIRILNNSGGTRWVEIMSSLIDGNYNSHGEGYFRIVFSDISRRKQAEDEKAKLEAQLNHASKLETIGKLAGGIAHDFNNILTPIIGYAEMGMADFPSSEPAFEYMEQISLGAKRAQELVEQILLFSRPNERKRQSVSVQLLIEEALKLLRPSIPTTIEICEQIDGDCGHIWADPIQIHRIVVNLCTNAWQALDGTSGKINIKLEQVQADTETASLHANLTEGAYAKLSVSDTGCGMQTKTLNHIFDPFFTTKSPDTGTGMGLSVVHGIVRGHGGEILVSSQYGQGTTFTVYLPIDNTKPTSPPVRAQKTEKDRESVLLVDDEKMIVDMLKKVLSRLGYTVDAQTDSTEALNVYQAHPSQYDLIISDLNMPKMTGLQLSEAINQISPKTPIIIMTGYDRETTSQDLKDSGIAQVLQKPISMKSLAAAIRKILDAP